MPAVSVGKAVDQAAEMVGVSGRLVQDAKMIAREMPELRGAGGDGPVRGARGVQGAHHGGQGHTQDMRRAVPPVGHHERAEVRPHDRHYLLGVTVAP